MQIPTSPIQPHWVGGAASTPGHCASDTERSILDKVATQNQRKQASKRPMPAHAAQWVLSAVECFVAKEGWSRASLVVSTVPASHHVLRAPSLEFPKERGRAQTSGRGVRTRLETCLRASDNGQWLASVWGDSALEGGNRQAQRFTTQVKNLAPAAYTV